MIVQHPLRTTAAYQVLPAAGEAGEYMCHYASEMELEGRPTQVSVEPPGGNHRGVRRPPGGSGV